MTIEQLPIEWLDIDAITPYDKNPRKNNKAVRKVADSIKEFGFNQPIVVDSSGVIVVGHTRHKAAEMLGLDQVPVITLKGLDPMRVKAYRIADNKLNELAEWDDELLLEELNDLVEASLEELSGFDEKEINDLVSQNAQSDNPYTTKVDTPIYTPTGDCPRVYELYDNSRVERLKQDIAEANVDDDVRAFLMMAAERHRRFDYRQIAEYYAHADAETQKLMEDSALVIIDFDRAIELGYVRLTEELKQAHADDYGNE